MRDVLSERFRCEPEPDQDALDFVIEMVTVAPVEFLLQMVEPPAQPLMFGWLGTQPASGAFVLAARIFSVVYFAFFLLMPYYTTIDKTKPVPDRVV